MGYSNLTEWSSENTGDNAWQLTAASLVALQSVPGLVVLYAGIVKTKWAINSAFMAFYAFAAVLICWVLWGYKVGFGEQMLPFAGYPGPVVTIEQELANASLPTANLNPNFPMATMIYFQFVFAAITVIIMAGAFLGRMNFFAWMIFVPFWLTFSYCIGAFSLWGGGFLFQLGVIDYSGGYVIHLSQEQLDSWAPHLSGHVWPQTEQTIDPTTLALFLLELAFFGSDGMVSMEVIHMLPVVMPVLRC
jgi:Amt family ammonium transporter